MVSTAAQSRTDPVGRARVGLGRPVARHLGAAQHHPAVVREHVDQLVVVVRLADEELGQARVLGHHDLAAVRDDGRVRDQVVRPGPGAVHDHRGGRAGGRLGQRGHGADTQLAAGLAEPAQQVVQVHRHRDDRGGVPPARHEAGRQAGRGARLDPAAHVGQLGEQVRVGVRRPDGHHPAGQPDAGAGLAGQPGQRAERVRRTTRRPGRCPRPGAGPRSAPATADVVRPGGSAAWITTRRPASARQTAVLRPATPAPITRASVTPALVTPAR